MATPRLLKYPTLKLRRLKYPLRQLHLHVIGVRHDIHTDTVTLGNPGADWRIDPAPLNAGSVVYSFGIGNDASFDLALIGKFGCTVHGFDPTPRSAQWVAAQDMPAAFVFHQFGIASFDGTLQFFEPKSKSSFHFTPVQRYAHQRNGTIDAPVRRLETVMRELGHDRVDLLKLDIEGGEYDVIEDILQSPIRPGQILIEFHHMFSTIPMKRTLDAVRALRAAGYGILHITPRTYEYTFVYRGDGASH